MVHQDLEDIDRGSGIGMPLGIGVPVGVENNFRLVERQHLRHPLAVDLDHGGDEDLGKGSHPGSVLVPDRVVRHRFGAMRIGHHGRQQPEVFAGSMRESSPGSLLLRHDEGGCVFGDGKAPPVSECLVIVIDQNRLSIAIFVKAVPR